jgi:hypothetical protein
MKPSVVMLVKPLARRKDFLLNNELVVKKDHLHALGFRPGLPGFLWALYNVFTESCFEYSCISDAVFPSLKQNLTQMRGLFKSVIRKLWIELNMHKLNSLREATQRVLEAKFARPTQMVAIL